MGATPRIELMLRMITKKKKKVHRLRRLRNCVATQIKKRLRLFQNASVGELVEPIEAPTAS
jgi:hypothetical protein